MVTNPASGWPTYAQIGRQLLQEQKVAALFGCWTSVSRKSVLPVVEQNDGLLYYPLHFEGEENSKNVVHLNSPPSSSVLPAVDYLMGADVSFIDSLDVAGWYLSTWESRKAEALLFSVQP